MNNWTHCILHIGEEKGQPVYIDSWDKDHPSMIKIQTKSDYMHDNCSSIKIKLSNKRDPARPRVNKYL